MMRTTTKHGYAILERKPSTVPGSEIVVAWRKEYAFAPFAVWRMETDSGECHGGDYCTTLANAAAAFEDRL